MEIDNYMVRNIEMYDEEEVELAKPMCPICKNELSEGEREGIASDWFCIFCEGEFNNEEVS